MKKLSSWGWYLKGERIVNLMTLGLIGVLSSCEKPKERIYGDIEIKLLGVESSAGPLQLKGYQVRFVNEGDFKKKSVKLNEVGASGDTFVFRNATENDSFTADLRGFERVSGVFLQDRLHVIRGIQEEGQSFESSELYDISKSKKLSIRISRLK